MRIYTLTIVYNKETEEIEYISEEIEGDEKEILLERGVVDIGDYFDEETMKLITGCYIVGEA
jgi:hypothetical protein